MPLDPTVRALLDAVSAAGMPQIGTVTAQEMRAIHKAIPPGPNVFKVEDTHIPSPAGGMAARLYWPTAKPNALVVYFHGGGWSIGSVDGWDGAMRRMANACGSAILSVDYRLAPEARFPAAVDDAKTAVWWAAANLGKLAGGPVPLIVAGDSAGGNLAAVTTLAARDEAGPAVAAQILIYPSVDGDIDSPSLDSFESPFLTKSEIAWSFDQYIPDRSKRKDPRFAPLLASNLGGLPPTFVLTAENDLLAHEATLYAQKLIERGVKVKTKCYLGTIHGFFTIDRGMLPHSTEARQDIAKFIAELI
jgi:acetyl esterase